VTIRQHKVSDTDSTQPTLDVEAAIRNDRLDFGVFGLQSRLQGMLAERVIEGVRQEMSELAEENGVSV
jgi:hypothetical protein